MDMLVLDSLDNLIEYYFTTLRAISEQMGEPPPILRDNSFEMLQHIVSQILTSTETPERQIILLNRINTRFMTVLVDYDRPWVWQLLRGFSAECPTEHLN